MKQRQAMPESELTSPELKRLYNRYHSLAHKARSKRIPFHWKGFSGFYEDLKKSVPADYHPDKYRMRFDLNMGVGYAPESLMVVPKGETSKSAKEKIEETRAGIITSFETEFAIRLLTEEGSYEELINEAYSAARAAA